MRAATGSQCKETKRGVTWALLGSFGLGMVSLKTMPRCPPGSLRSVQLPLDPLVEMRDRAVCHQRRNSRRSHVPV